MKTIKKVWAILDKKQKIKVGFLMFMIFIGGVMETLGVTMVLPLLEAFTDTEKFARNAIVEKVMNLFGIADVNVMIILLIIALIGIFLFKNLYLLLQYYVQAKFINNNRSRVSKDLLALYVNRPYEFFLNTDTPTILRAVYSDMDHIFNLILQYMMLATEVVVALCISIVIVIIDFKMTITIVLLMLMATIFVSKVVKKKLNQVGSEARKEQANLYKWVLQSATGIKDIKVLGCETYFTDEYGECATRFAKYQAMNTVLTNTPRLLIETVAICGVLGYMAVNLLMGQEMGNMMGMIGAFGVAALRLLPSVNRLNTHLANISYYEPSLNDFYENVDMDELRGIQAVLKEKEERKKEETLTLKDMVELKNITYAYPNTTKLIFDNADMEIPVGKSVGVVGSSGAGKTTVVDILLGLLNIKDGKILSDGKDIFENMSAWINHIGYIPQTIYMLDDTIRNNVAFGVNPDEIDDERVWKVLEEAQIKEYVEQLEDGLDSEIGERGVRISGGQRQRLGIARALYHDPELLVFDEATSALDTDTETAIMEAVENLHGRKTMVIIAHRLRTIENCDIIYEVKDGKIVKQSEK